MCVPPFLKAFKHATNFVSFELVGYEPLKGTRPLKVQEQMFEQLPCEQTLVHSPSLRAYVYWVMASYQFNHNPQAKCLVPMVRKPCPRRRSLP